jgi:Domain of unknown function (DUF6438)
MTKRKSILIILSTSLWLSSFAQLNGQGLITGSLKKIDSLQTDKEVFSFLKRQFPEYNGNETFDNYRNETQQIADSLEVKNWVKTDIDNNGETDLLIFRANDLSDIFAILSNGGTFKAISAQHFCKYQFIYPVVKAINNRNVIFLFSQDQTDYDAGTRHFIYTRLICDTLVVKDNLFVNYLRSPRREEVEKIELINDGECEGNCPRINISIDAKTFSNTCSKTMFAPNGRKLSTGRLSQNEIREMVSLLNYSNFTELNESYEVGCTDLPTTTLIITYDGGKTKTIRDYGSSGNFTLTEIYKIAYSIKWTEEKGSQ